MPGSVSQSSQLHVHVHVYTLHDVPITFGSLIMDVNLHAGGCTMYNIHVPCCI